MAVKLIRPIERELFSTTRSNENIVITLKAGDLVEFRVKGRRTRVEVSLAHCFVLAQLIDANIRYNEAMKAYAEKKKMGLKARKPKKVAIPVNKIYFKALE